MTTLQTGPAIIPTVQKEPETQRLNTLPKAAESEQVAQGAWFWPSGYTTFSWMQQKSQLSVQTAATGTWETLSRFTVAAQVTPLLWSP